MELYRKVRQAYFRQGMSKRGISRHFGISRDSVDKMIVYSVPPGYRRTAPVKRPKLDGFTEIIDAARGPGPPSQAAKRGCEASRRLR